jgi:hypothetical protein
MIVPVGSAGRDGVDVFRANALALEIVERIGERVHLHAVAVERNADRGDAKPGETVDRALVALLLDDDGVATRQHHAVDQVERLERAGGDEDIVGGAGHAGVALELSDQEIAQRPIALRPACEAVGGQRPALALEHRMGGGDQAVERQFVGIVVAAGEIVPGQAVHFAAPAGIPAGPAREVERGSHADVFLILILRLALVGGVF